MTIKLTSVIEYYEALPHQKKAIDYLQSAIPADVLAYFADLWRDDPKPTKPKQLITMQQATSIFGKAPLVKQFWDLNACLNRFEINTNLRLKHFLAQIAHESGGLRWMQERATGDAYEWRRNLGNVKPGDGRKYKGAGAIQLTGRANYQVFADYMNDQKIMQGSDFVSTEYPFTSAGFWWLDNGMNARCDRGDTLEQISRMVNLGGAAGVINGLADRQMYFDRVIKVLG